MMAAETSKQKILSRLYDEMRKAKTPEEQEVWMNVVEIVTEVLPE